MELRNPITFEYSFGYDCLRNYNLCSCDKDTIVWAAGSYISIYNIALNQMSFKRSNTGGTIGHIIKNPSKSINHIAVGESGIDNIPPQIIIYEWPSMNISVKLLKGTSKQYVNIDYSPDGNLLASVGSSPTYFLTIWDWKNGQIKLQCHAFHNPVLNVQFSPNNFNQLITSGSNHIKFWKITETFTGLKLLGKLGKFGKINVSDILGVLHMPKEIILSGCFWGNILVWENGQIKYEISRKGKNPCHGAPITQIVKLTDSEVITVGLDGKLCTWHWEAMDRLIHADSSEIVQLEVNPIAEIEIHGAKFMNICHRENDEWFAQDANGCVWNIKLDEKINNNINKIKEETKTRPIFHSHGGKIIGLIVTDNLIISVGEDGTMFYTILPHGPLVYQHKLHQPVSAMLNLSYNVTEPFLKLIVVGYVDGTIQLICLDIECLANSHKSVSESKISVVIQHCKPHSKKVTALRLNNSMLITASEDFTIFLFTVDYENGFQILKPFCLLETPEIVSSIIWKNDNDSIILLSGFNGLLMEAEFPKNIGSVKDSDIITYKKSWTSLKQWKINKYELQHKLNDQDKIITRENINSIELVSHPDDFNKQILWAVYKINSNKDILFAQENCNCIFFMNIDSSSVYQYIPLDGSPDSNITIYLYLPEKNISLMGTNNGEIVVASFSNKKTEQNLCDEDLRKFKKNQLKPVESIKIILSDLYKLSIHDNVTGAVTAIDFSPENKYLITAGEDGNVFCFKNNNIIYENKQYLNTISLKNYLLCELHPDDYMKVSHEEKVQQREKQRLLKLADEEKSSIESELSQLKTKFNLLMEQNKTMPLHLQVSMGWEPRILNNVNNQLEEEKATVYQEMAFPLSVSNMRLERLLQRNVDNLDMFPFQVNSILKHSLKVFSIRQNKLNEDFFNDFDKLKDAIKKLQTTSLSSNLFSIPRTSIDSIDSENSSQSVSKSEQPKENEILKNFPKSIHPPHIFTKAVREYINRIDINLRQKQEWEEHLKKQLIDYELSNDIVSESNNSDRGKYHLKSTLDFFEIKPIEYTQIKMFETRQMIFEIQSEFNTAIVRLRNDKIKLVDKFNKLVTRHNTISKIIPVHLIKQVPVPIPDINEEEENPEKILEKHKNIHFTKPKIKNENTDKFDIIKNNDLNYQMYVEGKLEKNESLPIEIRENYMLKLLDEQDMLINEMKTTVDNWEKQLNVLFEERDNVLLNAQHLKLYLLQLHQELIIRESFQNKEKDLETKITHKQNELKDIHEGNKKCLQETNYDKSELKKILDECENYDRLHKNLITGVKYATFLRKVFKSKNPSSIMDESNQLGDTISGDSLSESEDEKVQALDPNICPPGCDPQRFEESIELRKLREERKSEINKLENSIREKQENIQLSAQISKTTVIELEQLQAKLKELIVEKQKQINDIDVVVLLSAKQLNMDAYLELCKANQENRTPEVLILELDTIKELEDRVIKLNEETEELNRKHEIDKKRLKDIRLECKRKREEVQILHTECRKVLSQKLTPEVVDYLGKDNAADATKILDTVLEKMAQELQKSSHIGNEKEKREELNYLKGKEKELQIKYCDLLQEYTKKMEIGRKLLLELNIQKTSSDKVYKLRSTSEYKKDIERLKKIKLQQQQQIEDLRYQIQKLKFKPSCDVINEPIGSSYRSLPPSTSESPIPPTATSSHIRDTKSLVTSLVMCIKQFEISICDDAEKQGLLMNSLAKVFPLLLKGQLNIHEATTEILKNVPSSLKAEESNDGRRLSIQSVLSEITAQNVEFGDFEDFTPSVVVEKKHECGPLIAEIVKGLLDANINSNDLPVIDGIVEALINMVPRVLNQQVLREDIIEYLQDLPGFNNKSSIIEELISSILECLASSYHKEQEESSNRSTPTSKTTKSAPVNIGKSQDQLEDDQNKIERTQTS